MKITEYLKRNILILDGGMGTMLQKAGLAAGESSESCNITHPETVKKIHKAYFEAGSNVISTNTFGVNSLKYNDDRLKELIHAAVAICKEAAEESDAPQEKFIAFDVGPTGKLLRPYGDLEFDDAVEIFAKNIRIAVECGVDLIFIETMNDSYETKAALLAAKENSSLPVFVSNAYSEDGKLVTGATPSAMAAMLCSMGADAIGANCSFGPDKTYTVIKELLKYSTVPVIMKPNAGLPSFENGLTYYNIEPEHFADEITAAVSAGVRIVGGCCGTTPDFISAVKSRVKDIKPCTCSVSPKTVISSYTHTVEFGYEPVLIGERINPTGKKRFKQALVENDIDYILSEGISQQERGVHVLDVNVGLAGIDECAMLKSAVKELQAVCDLPLQLDSSDPVALEGAMRIYNGKPLINSVNGKEESMNAVFPLVKKYGGAIIALTLDENGIPGTAEGRLEIAKRIVSEAKKYGINREDIIFDPLTMTVSTDKKAADITLESLRLISEKLGCCTSLGVSNVSFGLPAREKLNSTFFNMALMCGLDAAIINPYSDSMMDVYYSYCALRGMDENFEAYIPYAQSDSGKEKSTVSADNDNDLTEAIFRGRKEQAARISQNLCAEKDSIEIINNYIIPALDKTGIAFEKGTMFLPQLLMSAEAASAAFDSVKNNTGGSTDKKCRIVIATVKGDIHDIGKNIVKLLLQNYGFEVIDLGKNVEPSDIVEAIKHEKAPLAGLSALMTTTLDAMKETVKLIKETSPECRVFVGGAVVNEEFAASINADKYTKDAMSSVRYAEKVFDDINGTV